VGVWHGAGEPVEFGDDQGVADGYRGQRLVQSGARAVGAGEALVELDPVLGHAEGDDRQFSLVGSYRGVPSDAPTPLSRGFF
jgi:hypothetical protein